MTGIARLAAATVLALAQAPLAAQDVTVSVDAGQSGPQISRHVFGQFAEHLGTGIYGGLWVGPDSEMPTCGAFAPTWWKRSRS